MGLKSYVPGTQARRDRLFQTIVAKEVGDMDGLALIEWEDKSVTLAPVEWDSDNSAIVDDQNNRFFARGLGSDPKTFAGVPVWYVYAGNAGIISTEACLIADVERYEDRVYDVGAGEELPDDLVAEGLIDPNGEAGPGDAWTVEQVDRDLVETARAIARGELEAIEPAERDRLEARANGAPDDDDDEGGGGLLNINGWKPNALRDVDGENSDGEADGEVATDGGLATRGRPGNTPLDAGSDLADEEHAPDPGEDAAVYDLRPPDGYDGVAIDPRQPDAFDPNPVTRADAKGAVEWAQRAEADGTDTWMYGFIVGLLVFAGIWLLMTVIPWLLSQIGGGGGGGTAVPGLLLFAAVPASPVRRMASTVRERVPWGD